MRLSRTLTYAFIATGLFASNALAAEYVITLKDQQFSPTNLVVPAGEKVKLTIKNMDARAAEFESHELNREKIISAGGQAVVFIGPLEAGTYPYMDEFNADKAKGTITAK